MKMSVFVFCSLGCLCADGQQVATFVCVNLFASDNPHRVNPCLKLPLFNNRHEQLEQLGTSVGHLLENTHLCVCFSVLCNPQLCSFRTLCFYDVCKCAADSAASKGMSTARCEFFSLRVCVHSHTTITHIFS